MRIIPMMESRRGIVVLGAMPLLVLMLVVGIGHADSWKHGSARGERGSVGSWARNAHADAQAHVQARSVDYERGGRGDRGQAGQGWQGRGDSGGRRYKPDGGGRNRSGGDYRSGGGYSGGSRGGYSGGYSRGGYSGGYSRGGTSGGYDHRVRYRPGAGYRGGYGGGYGGYGGGYGGYGYRRVYSRPYYYSRPRSYVRVGIGFGYPRYGYYHPRPVIVAPVRTIVITNTPPAGCYYYDPYCDYRFDCLDDFYEHMQDCDHDATLEVMDGDDQCIGTYGYAEGQWSPMN